MAKTEPEPPATYLAFVQRYPQLGQAWEAIHEAGDQGPLDERTSRLVKLGIAIGAMREGAVHSSVRKALAMGVRAAEIEQVIALAASTLGMPATVAVYTWIADYLTGSPAGSHRRPPGSGRGGAAAIREGRTAARRAPRRHT